MDEAMKRRLVGVLVIVVVVFVISLLLPHPGTVQTDENNQRVTLDLTGKEPEPLHSPMTPVPPVIAAAPANKEEPKPVATPDHDTAAPQPEELSTSGSNLPPESMTDDEPTSNPQASTAKPKDEAAAAKPEKPAPAKPESASGTQAEAKPKVKLEDSLKQKTAKAASTKPAEKTPPKTVAAAPADKPKPAALAVAKTRWFVQVGAFNDIAKARQVIDKLGPKGLKAIISPLDSAKGTLYRVRIGPLTSREQAKQAQDKAAALGFAGSSVIED
jgi:DedD protein